MYVNLVLDFVGFGYMIDGYEIVGCGEFCLGWMSYEYIRFVFYLCVSRIGVELDRKICIK